MTTAQLWILAGLSLLGLCMLTVTALLAIGYGKFQRSRARENNLLKRLENNAMLKAARPARRKYLMFWSKP